LADVRPARPGLAHVNDIRYIGDQHQERGFVPGQPASPGKVARVARRGCGRQATKRETLLSQLPAHELASTIGVRRSRISLAARSSTSGRQEYRAGGVRLSAPAGKLQFALDSSQCGYAQDATSHVGASPDRFRADLLRYWARMHVMPLTARMLQLKQIPSTRRDACALREMAVAALADHSIEIAFAATLRYLAAPRRRSVLHAAHIDDALQWTARRLALRPEAVFAALLVQHDASIESRLLPLRAVTTRSAVLGVLDAVGRHDTAGRSDFVAQWQALELTPIAPCAQREQ